MNPAALDPPITDEAVDIDRVWDLFLYLGLAVFAFVALLVLYVIVRYRRRDGTLPRQRHYNIPLEIAYTLIPLLVVIGLFAVTVVSVNAIEEEDPDPDLVVDVTAFQWQWAFDYPESGVSVVGGAGDDTPTLVLPAESSVRFNLQSLDVVHSFWITAFRFKRDIIPGQTSSFTMHLGDHVGEYPNAGVCAEYCGLDHAFMRFGVTVLPPAEFEAWLSEQAANDAGDADAPAEEEGT